MPTTQQMVAEFHDRFGVPNHLGDGAGIPSADRLKLRTDLIEEEFTELYFELIPAVEVERVAQEAADLVYVIYGMALEFGIDLDAVIAEVHRSNMTKISPDGTVKRRDDGKILKPATYSPADVKAVLRRSEES